MAPVIIVRTVLAPENNSDSINTDMNKPRILLRIRKAQTTENDFSQRGFLVLPFHNGIITGHIWQYIRVEIMARANISAGMASPFD